LFFTVQFHLSSTSIIDFVCNLAIFASEGLSWNLFVGRFLDDNMEIVDLMLNNYLDIFLDEKVLDHNSLGTLLQIINLILII
jgi:hypothetical protein